MDFITKNRLHTDKAVKVAIVAFVTAYIIKSFFPIILVLLGYVVDILSPFLLAMILYYLFRPIVSYLKKWLTVYGAIAVSFVILFGFITFVVIFIYPAIVAQVDSLKNANMEHFFTQEGGQTLLEFKRFHFTVSDQTKAYVLSALKNLNIFTATSIADFLSFLTKFVFALVISPFILFFFLKDDTKISKGVIHAVPDNHKKRVKSYMRDIDEMLVHFINGRFIIGLICGVLLLIGFLLIGLPYPFILALFSLIFYIIPTVGAFIAMVIPILVGFSMGVQMGIETTCLVVLVGCLEGMFISNIVMGKTLFIHPLTSIIVLLVGGVVGGIIGLLFSIPAYVLIKITLTHLFRYKEEVSKN